MKVNLFIYFRKIEFSGEENIPKDAPFIYAANHQNSLLDGILIGCLSPLPVYYFTRADVFKTKLKPLIEALNMMPVYRIRDGFSAMAQNQQIFSTAKKLLLEGKRVMIFPEASHVYHYHLNNISKGVPRLGLMSQIEVDTPIYIVPMGLNYYDHETPRHKLSIHYGKPINLLDYKAAYEEHKAKALNKLKKDVVAGMKKTLFVPDQGEHYDAKVAFINRRSEKFKFHEMQEKLLNVTEEPAPFKPNVIINLLIQLLTIIHLPIIGLSRYVLKNKLKDRQFVATVKLMVQAVVAPFYYGLIWLILCLVFGLSTGSLIILGIILSLFLRQELVRLNKL